MGKKKGKGEYNDFLDGEKLRDNDSVKTTLQSTPAQSGSVSPPHTSSVLNSQGKGSQGNSGSRKPQLTHFLCLPLINPDSRPQLQQALNAFQLELEKGGVIPPKAVRPIGTLHLTLGVMSLDAARLEDAKDFLQSVDLKNILSHSQQLRNDAGHPISAHISVTEPPEFVPLAVSLMALMPMHQIKKTSVLYAEPRDTSGRLYSFATALRDQFTDQGFIVDEKRALKLHATIVNSVYAKSGGRGSNAKNLLRFDATDLVKQHADFVWADAVAIDRLQICKMGAKKIKDEDGNIIDEEYEVIAEKTI